MLAAETLAEHGLEKREKRACLSGGQRQGSGTLLSRAPVPGRQVTMQGGPISGPLLICSQGALPFLLLGSTQHKISVLGWVQNGTIPAHVREGVRSCLPTAHSWVWDSCPSCVPVSELVNQPSGPPVRWVWVNWNDLCVVCGGESTVLGNPARDPGGRRCS